MNLKTRSKKSLVKPIKEDKPKKIPKSISGFDEKIKEIFSKLINKHKVDGIYTKKIIEKKEALDKYGSEGSGKNLPFSSLSEDLKKKDEEKE